MEATARSIDLLHFEEEKEQGFSQFMLNPEVEDILIAAAEGQGNSQLESVNVVCFYNSE